ncbi:MAG: ATP-binding protein [Anaerolineae bacterium]
MKRRIPSTRQRRFVALLTLRWRLTLWTTGLFLVLGLSLALFINSMTAIQIPQVLQVELEPTSHPPSDHAVVSLTPSPEALSRFEETPNLQTPNIQEVVIRQVRIISLIGIGLFALVGSVGAYWIAKQSLRPVSHLSHLAQKIQARTLDQRLPTEGPPDELKELADAFNGMLARLESAFEQQNRFVADAAHELRTPLAILRTNLEVAQRDPDITVADYKEISSVLERALSRLEQLVEDLLLLAKGEKELRAAPVKLETLLQEIVQELEPLAQTRHIHLELNIVDPATVMADVSLLGRAVSNLLENGIRYNHAGGSVTMTVRRATHGVELCVEDTGIGIPVEAQPHIFERFYRVDPARSREQGGSGLGLSIAAYVIQLHGGWLRLTKSIPGMGSQFTMWLPTQVQASEETSNLTTA